jgi:hypothetical protein
MYENLIKYYLDHDCNQSEPQIVRGINNQSNSNPELEISPETINHSRNTAQQAIRRSINQSNSNSELEISPETTNHSGNNRELRREFEERKNFIY